MEKYGGNLKPKRKLKRAAATAPARLGGPLSGKKPGSAAKRKAAPPTIEQSMRSVARTVRSTGGDPLKELAGIGRVVGHGVGALAESTYKDPLGSAAKTATSAGEIAKGVAGAAIGLPVYAVEHPLKTLSGEGSAHIA